MDLRDKPEDDVRGWSVARIGGQYSADCQAASAEAPHRLDLLKLVVDPGLRRDDGEEVERGRQPTPSSNVVGMFLQCHPRLYAEDPLGTVDADRWVPGLARGLARYDSRSEASRWARTDDGFEPISSNIVIPANNAPAAGSRDACRRRQRKTRGIHDNVRCTCWLLSVRSAPRLVAAGMTECVCP